MEHESHQKNTRNGTGMEGVAEMRSAGQTYDDLLAEMIELRKKRRLLEDICHSMEENDFVPLSEIKL